MSCNNNCGDFIIYDDCCKDNNPKILTREGTKPVEIDYIENPFNGIILTGKISEIPNINLNNVPTGELFSLIIDISGVGPLQTNNIVINDISGTSPGNTRYNENLIIVGETQNKLL